MKKLTEYAAYHGKKFKKRIKNLSEEKGTIYSSFSTNSEFAELKAVMLYCPGNELKKITKPDHVQHLDKIDSKKIAIEFKNLAKAFKKEKIETHFLETSIFKALPPPNLMFVRDLFWNGIDGAIVGRVGSIVRAGEEKYAACSLSSINIPIILGVHQSGTFEAADLLWLDSQTLICGIGNRTNTEGLEQIKSTLQNAKTKIIPVPLPKETQHLLGLIQIVAKDTALLRVDLAPKSLTTLLKKKKFKIIAINESDEVTKKQGMNIVTIRPREIFMPKGCPVLKKLYKENGIKILAELSIDEILKAAGGLACATGILSRKLI